MTIKKLQSILLTILISLTALLYLSSCGPVYQLSVESSGGTITMNPGGGSYFENQIVTLSADPDSGYYFTGWGNIASYSNDSAVSDEISIVMPSEALSLTAGFAEKGKGWTYLVYLAGDNSLSSFATADLNEMEEGLYDAIEAGNMGVSSDVKILVLADFSGSGNTSLYLISPDNTNEIISSKITGGAFPSSVELNMGDPDTLSDFIEYGLGAYPSLYNALILWNHGGGAKSIDFNLPQSREICSDETSGDSLYNDEVQQGIKAGLAASDVAVFDIIGMDACLMGTVETAYELKDLGSYFAASPAEEWIYGWDYQHLFGNFSVSGSIPAPPAMVDMIVSQYKVSTDTESTSLPNTLTAVDLSKMSALKTEIDKLAGLLHGIGQSSFEAQREASGYFYDIDPDTSRIAPYTDLYSFCKGLVDSIDAAVTAETKTQAGIVLTALDTAVVGSYAKSSGIQLDNYYATADENAVRGLSIFISHGEKGHYADQWWYTDHHISATDGSSIFYLGNLDFCTTNTNGQVESWQELFEAWYDPDNSLTLGGSF